MDEFLKQHMEDDRVALAEIRQELREIKSVQQKILLAVEGQRIKLGAIGSVAGIVSAALLNWVLH